MGKFSAGLGTLAVAGVSLVGAFSGAGPATAKTTCQLKPKSDLVPYLVSPCNGSTIKLGTKAVTFTVSDVNAKSKPYHPYLNLRTNATRTKGHLPADTSGNGIYSQLSPVKGHPGRWTLTDKNANFPSFWLEHKGTYYVQIQQIDDRAGVGDTYYSPVVTLHVR